MVSEAYAVQPSNRPWLDGVETAWQREMCPEALMSTPELARRCAEEIDKFRRGLPNDAQIGYELMRRALAEESAEALAYVYELFGDMVTGWVYQHRALPETGESVEFFTASAFQSFYFALRGPRFAAFPNLAAVLRYLKRCAFTAVGQYLRDHARCRTLPIDTQAELPAVDDPAEGMAAADLWSRILRLLPDRRDQLLARCAFVLDLKPREICAAYPQQWENARAVCVALYRIRSILRSDPEIAALA